MNIGCENENWSQCMWSLGCNWRRLWSFWSFGISNNVTNKNLWRKKKKEKPKRLACMFLFLSTYSQESWICLYQKAYGTISKRFLHSQSILGKKIYPFTTIFKFKFIFTTTSKNRGNINSTNVSSIHVW